jgi:hypothetical protein
MIQTPAGKNKKKLDINYAHQVFGHADFGLVVKTCLELGWKLTGTPETCEACALAKAKAKKVKKFTDDNATRAGERLFVDLSGCERKSLLVFGG